MDFSVKLLNVGEKMEQQQHPEKIICHQPKPCAIYKGNHSNVPYFSIKYDPPKMGLI